MDTILNKLLKEIKLLSFSTFVSCTSHGNSCTMRTKTGLQSIKAFIQTGISLKPDGSEILLKLEKRVLGTCTLTNQIMISESETLVSRISIPLYIANYIYTP